MISGQLPDYEISYEYDGEEYTGSISAFNIYGHGHHPDTIDTFLDAMGEEGYADGGSWEVRETYLRKVPTHDGSLHIYGSKGRGARAVTVIERESGWDYWCINHPCEPATSGIPATQCIDGEVFVTQRLIELEQETEPRYDVHRWDSRFGSSSSYIYMCRECSDDFHDRLAAARKEALSKL